MYYFQEPTNGSHPIKEWVTSYIWMSHVTRTHTHTHTHTHDTVRGMRYPLRRVIKTAPRNVVTNAIKEGHFTCTPAITIGWCVYMCCSVLQCIAVCCSVLQCVAVRCSALQCVEVCCSVLSCTLPLALAVCVFVCMCVCMSHVTHAS